MNAGSKLNRELVAKTLDLQRASMQQLGAQIQSLEAQIAQARANAHATNGSIQTLEYLLKADDQADSGSAPVVAAE